MNYNLSKLTKKIGLPPGTIMQVGASNTEPLAVEQVIYTAETFTKSSPNEVSDIVKEVPEDAINWVDVRGVHVTDAITKISAQFYIHSLMTEDIVNTLQLPKIEEQEDCFFVVMKAISFEESKLELEHICLYFREGVLLSFQEKSSDTFSIVRDRIQAKKGKIHEKKADYLLYALLDYIIDTYFDALQKIDNHILTLSEEVDQESSRDTLKSIQSIKKQVLSLKRHFWYTRDIVLALKKSDSSLILDSTNKYLVDLNDHIAHIVDISESFREELIDLTERHLSGINLRSNDIMKMLTIVAAIFMPLTFLAGIYGMNFKYMPELNWMFGYPLLLLIMVGISICLLFFFNRKKWLD